MKKASGYPHEGNIHNHRMGARDERVVYGFKNYADELYMIFFYREESQRVLADQAHVRRIEKVLKNK